MLGSISKEIEQGYILLNEGKIEQAYQLVVKTENQENLSPSEALQTQLLKGTLLIYLLKLEAAIKIGEQVFQESKILNKPCQSVEAIVLKFGALFALGRVGESWEDIEYGKKLLKSNYKWTSSELEHSKAMIAYLKGSFHHRKSEEDLALKNLLKSLAYLENSKLYSFMVPQILTIIGDTYHWKGELEKARKNHERALKLAKGTSPLIKSLIATSEYSLGVIHHRQGEPDLAIEYYKKSLNIFEKHGMPFYIGAVYDRIIITYLDQHDYKKARYYLTRFHEQLSNTDNKIVYDTSFYELSRARILKSSTRTRDRAKAEKILKNLLKKEIDVNSPSNITFLGQIHLTLIVLCELYFTELNLTNDLRILDDIDPLIERLIKEANRTNSSSLLANAYLLKGKTALLRMNMGEARRYLTQAQHIAELKGFSVLAKVISRKHDSLLEQLDEWDNLKKKKGSMSERMDLALVDEIIDRIQFKGNVEGLELTEEEPILLMIIAEGGLLLFSYPFAKEWENDEELLGSFLSAFTSFSEEFFSQELDRAKFGIYNVIMKSVFSFTICYLIKGQSYLALKKLERFTETIRENNSIVKILLKFQEMSQLLEVKDFPFFKSLITEIFVKE